VNGSGGGSGGFGQSSTIKQKDFIIKKMFKVPSNEQMNQSPSLAIQQASSTFKQPPQANGINIFNVNPVNVGPVDQPPQPVFHSTFYNQ
jgi:hypothetical protein